VKLTVLAVGRVRPPFSDDVAHYERLLAAQAKLALVEVREDERVERRIPERAYRVLLDVEGRRLDSVAFARWLEERRMAGQDVCFVVGGPYGTALQRCDERLSFGPMTFPHQLARVMLLEQLFRAHKILARDPYHH
jgi:23S rRNA (pseudouridine1915-N3)-methyltransferase